MFPPCSTINEKILPMVRSMVARRLVEMDWSQSNIAKKLGISQAMVSKYLIKPYPMEPFEEAENLAQETADLIVRGADTAAITNLVCKWCFSFKEKGFLCRYHPVNHCSVCMNLRSQEEVGERFTVLDDIETAVNVLKGVDIGTLSPQVRINIAQAIPGAGNTMDIASIPGRLIPLGNGVRTLAPPEFGVSRHLSALLLALMKRNQELKAVMNIRYDPFMDEVLKQGLFKAKFLDRAVFSNLEELIISQNWQEEDILVDPGDFGIEPCTYIFGTSAPRVVDRALQLMREFSGNILSNGSGREVVK